MNKAVTIIFGMVALSSSVGCTTVRTMSARQWINPVGNASAAPVAKAAGPAAEGAAPAAEGAAPAEAAPAAAAEGGISSHYYLTYWEGKCGMLGCSRGDTHVKRCKVNGDNSVECVEEAEAAKALNPQ